VRPRQNDPDKLTIAARLRTETALTLKAIAQRGLFGDLQRRPRDAAPMDAWPGTGGITRASKGSEAWLRKTMLNENAPIYCLATFIN
jgi:hypothetical protein